MMWHHLVSMSSHIFCIIIYFEIVFKDACIFFAHAVQNIENKTEKFRKITSYSYQKTYLECIFNSYANKLENPH